MNIKKQFFGVLCLVGVFAAFYFMNRSDISGIIEKSGTIDISGPIFGTNYGITVVGDYPGGSEKLRTDAEKLLNGINAEISTFDRSSELSRFNDSASTEPFPVSEDTATMMIAAFSAGRETKGVLDVTVGPLVELWGFGRVKRDEGYVPSDAEIAEAKKLVGLDKIHLDYGYEGATLRKDISGMRIDLATVGEGFAADKLAKMLDEAGVRNYLVHVAGAMRTKGFNQQGAPWRIAIEEPDGTIGSVNAKIDIHNMGVATAGSYRNYFEKDGKRYSHALNPNTGRPIEHETVSVTVIGESALFADAMDTGLLILGADEALKWADERNVAIYCLIKTKDGFKARYSRAFERHLLSQGSK